MFNSIIDQHNDDTLWPIMRLKIPLNDVPDFPFPHFEHEKFSDLREDEKDGAAY